ncbi:MAG: hypothetical protein NVS3B21_15620 [Acidimicrobiales bacterium]
MLRRIRPVTTFIVAALAACGTGSAWAQSAPVPPGSSGQPEVNSWALAPSGADGANQNGNRPSLSYEVSPGAVINDAVTLFNYSNVQLNFRLYATDAFNNSDGGFDALAGDQKPKDVGTWVDLPQLNITVPARKEAKVPVTIRVPPTARPGDHAGVVLASNSVPGLGPNGKTITVDRRTGPRVYVRVAGALTPEVAVVNMHSDYHPALNPFAGTVHMSYRIVNRGNVRLGVRQRVSVGGPFALGARSQRPKDLPELLPGQGANVTATFSGVPAAVIDTSRVRVEPLPVAGAALGKPTSHTQRHRIVAVPLSIVALILVVALLFAARRSYLRHGEGSPMSRRVPVHPQSSR